jgi:hypothetical protein
VPSGARAKIEKAQLIALFERPLHGVVRLTVQQSKLNAQQPVNDLKVYILRTKIAIKSNKTFPITENYSSNNFLNISSLGIKIRSE